MKTNAPKSITWIIALVLGIIAVVGKLAVITAIVKYAFWIVVIALVLLLLGSSLKGL